MDILRKLANRILRSTLLAAACLCAAQTHAFSLLACEGTTLDTGTGILSTPTGGAVSHRSNYPGGTTIYGRYVIVSTTIEQCPTNWLRYARIVRVERSENTTATSAGPLKYPKIFVLQDGNELGWFGGGAGPGSGFSWLPAGAPNQWLENPYYRGSFSETRRLVAEPGVPFDSLAPFQLRVEWEDLGAPYLVDVPAAVVINQIGYQIAGLWGDPAEPGWGVMMDQSLSGAVFAAWYTYDQSHQPVWFVMSNGRPVARHELEGDVYFPKGPPLSSGAYERTAFDPGAPVGKFRIAFSASDRAVLHFDVNGHRGSKKLELLTIRDAAGKPCTEDTGVYWNPAEPGQAVSLAGSRQIGCGLHALFATYDVTGRPTWYFGGLLYSHTVHRVMSRFDYYYTGTAYRPTGPYFAAPYASRRFELGSAAGEMSVTIFSHTNLIDSLRYGIGNTTRSTGLQRFTF